MRRCLNRLSLVFYSCGSLTLVGCGSEGTSATPTPIPAPTLSTLSVTPGSLSVFEGDSAQLTASGIDTQGRPITLQGLTWSSSNTSVVSVSSIGVVRALSVGSASVIAASGGKIGAASVQVSRAPARLSSIQASISPTALLVGSSANISLTGRDQYGQPFVPVAPTFSSNNTAVASVTSAGLVSGVAPGNATITVASAGVSTTVSVSVSSGVATQLRIARLAAGAMNGGVMSSQPVIELRDAQGNLAPASTVVTVEVGQGGTLTGTLAQNAVNGVATFTGLGIRGTAGTSVVLTFRAAQLTPQTQALTIGPFTFTNGTRLVGSQVLPGRYRSVNPGTASCYWARLRNLTGQGDIIANDFGSGPRLLEVLPTDLAIESSGCAPWAEIIGPVTSSPTAAFTDGMYLVGVDVAPGTWRSDGTGTGCYWARLRNINGTSDIIANNLQTAPAVVTVLPSDLAISVSGCGRWSRVE